MARTIMVVDDDESMRELLWLHLRMAGYSVRAYEDAIAAGYAVLQSAPDLLICDIAMPHLDGLEFVAALRADASIPRMPVIFLTAAGEGPDRAAELGAAEYLLKPLRTDDLLAAVAKHLPPRSALELRPARGSA